MSGGTGMATPARPHERTTKTTVARQHRTAGVLARVEGRRHLRHPLFLLACALSVVFFWQLTHADAPVLHRDDVTIAGVAWPIAVASLLVANLAALRSRRDDIAELYGSYSSERRTRVTGLLLSAAWPAVTVAVLAVVEAVWLKAAGGLGWPHPAELAVAPATVALAAAVGVALAVWVPSRLVAPVAIAGGAAVLLLATNTGPVAMSGAGRWSLPWVPIPGDAVLPELLVRPATAHLAYLVGLVLAVAAVARLSVRPRRPPAAAAALALLLVAGAGWAQSRHPTPAEETRQRGLLEQRDQHQICEVRRQVTYCAYPAYLPWIDRWAAAVEPVVDRLPDSVAQRGLGVRQWPSLWRLDPLLTDTVDVGQYRYPFTDYENTFTVFPIPDDGAIHPGARWGRGPAAGRSQLELGVQAAAWAVDLPTSPLRLTWTEEAIAGMTEGHGDDSVQHGVDPEDTVVPNPGDVTVEACDARGQARAVVALWLAARATPGAERALRDAVEAGIDELTWNADHGASISADPILFQTWGDEPPGEDTIDWGLVEADHALRLLDLPTEQLQRTIHEQWDLLTDPSTTTEELTAALGLDPDPTFRALLPDDAFAPARGRPHGIGDPLPGFLPTCP